MRLALTLLALLATGMLYAQVPGSILHPATPAINPMNPNGDGFVTSTNAAFVGPLDETQFELPFIPIHQYQLEPGADNQYAAGCELYEFVQDGAAGAESAYFYYKDPDGIPDNGDELIIFRFRMARWSNGVSAFSVLVDTDYHFGASGPEADPNTLPGNPGFEREIAVFNSTGMAGGVRVFNVDGKSAATIVNYLAPITSNYQVAYALNNDPACADRPVFVDMFVPFSAIGILSTTQIRMAVAVNEDIGSSLGGAASDIGGVDGTTLPNDDDQFIAAITGQSPIAIGNPLNNAPLAVDAAISIDENLSNGSMVHTVSASDINGDALAYSITGGNTGSAFAIDGSTGVIIINNTTALDREILEGFTLIVRVSDGLLYDNAIVTIQLNDINEGAPTITDAAVALSENSSNGSLVHSMGGADPDVTAVLTYSIINGNTGNAFKINSNTGVITVNDAAMLDFEVLPSFTLTVRVSDGVFFDDAEVTVGLTNVNESPSAQDASVSLDENSTTATAVHTISASDPDADTNLNYSILSGNVNNAFAINSMTGAITVSNAAALDFETTPSFTLTVRVSDGSLSDDAIVTIDVNDLNEAPRITPATLTVEENVGVGFVLQEVEASDPDADTQLSFSIVGGNTDDAFTIGNLSGEIKVNNSSALDFETNPLFQLKVRVSDGELFSDGVVVIKLLNVNEKPVVEDASITIERWVEKDEIILAVVATDPDADDVLTYKFADEDDQALLRLDAETGEISVLDIEALKLGTRTFDFMVSVTDRGGLAASASISIVIVRLPERTDIHPVKGFSPNNDGKNDFWMIEGIEAFPRNSIHVFNRWGITIYEANGYDNERQVWRGEVNGTISPIESTYFYVIKAGDFETITGYVIVKP